MASLVEGTARCQTVLMFLLSNYVVRIPNPASDIDGETNWPMIIGFFAVFVLAMFNIRAVASKTKAGIIAAVFPYIIMLVLLVCSVNLEGAMIGIRAFLVPKWSKLSESQVWADAMSQALYSLGVGFVALTAFGRKSSNGHNYCLSSLAVVVVGFLTSFVVGLATFSVLGHISYAVGVDIGEVVEAGPGLVFQLIPIITDHMYVPQLWSVLFFFVVIIIAHDNLFCEYMGMMAIVGDAFPSVVCTRNKKRCTRLFIGFVFFCLTIAPLFSVQAFYFFEMIDSYRVIGFSLVFVGTYEAITAGWLCDVKQFRLELAEITGSYLAAFIVYCCKAVSAALMLTVVSNSIVVWASSGDYLYPFLADVIGCILFTCILLCIPIYALYYFSTMNGGTFKQKLQRSLRPQSDEQNPEGDVSEQKPLQSTTGV